MTNIDTLHLRSHAEGVCRDHKPRAYPSSATTEILVFEDSVSEGLYTYSLDILCLMALTEALGLEYGDYTRR